MKYEFTGQSRTVNGVTVRQIKRISDGLIGGWIESEKNLDQNGDCFIYDNAVVYGDARIYAYASVYDDAKVSGDAEVFGNAAWITGDAEVSGNKVING